MKSLFILSSILFFGFSAQSELVKLEDPSKISCSYSSRVDDCDYINRDGQYTMDSGYATCVHIKYDERIIYNFSVVGIYGENISSGERAVLKCENTIKQAIAGSGYIILNGKVEPNSSNWMFISNKQTEVEVMNNFLKYKKDTDDRLSAMEKRVFAK